MPRFVAYNQAVLSLAEVLSCCICTRMWVVCYLSTKPKPPFRGLYVDDWQRGSVGVLGPRLHARFYLPHLAFCQLPHPKVGRLGFSPLPYLPGR